MKKRLLVLFALGILSVSACNNLASIPYAPAQTPESWLEIQPYWDIQIAGIEFVLVKPSSTLFVYLLGVITVGAGIYLLRLRSDQKTREWWGIALLLWGFGALFAGTSYQAFSYEIKCAGQSFCSWTSWWEIIYLLLSAASLDAILISGAYSSCYGKCRKRMITYAVFNIVLYSVAVLTGVYLLNKFLISFELLLIATAPNILFLFVLNLRRYLQHRNSQDLALMVTWLWLGLVIAAYFGYLVLGVTEVLWEQGIWFSENDVLHIGLISWMIYIAFNVGKRSEDMLPSDR